MSILGHLQNLVHERTHDLREALGWGFHREGLGVSRFRRPADAPFQLWLHQGDKYLALGATLDTAFAEVRRIANSVPSANERLRGDRQKIEAWLAQEWIGNAAYLTVAGPTLRALLGRLDLYERQLQEHVGDVCEKCGVDDACDGECVWIPNNAKGGGDAEA